MSKRRGRPARTDHKHTDLGRRLRIGRIALGYADDGKTTLEQYLKGTGIISNTYSQYESGRNYIPVASALKLKKKFKLSLDYIYAGETNMLPGTLRDLINAALSE